MSIIISVGVWVALGLLGGRMLVRKGYARLGGLVPILLGPVAIAVCFFLPARTAAESVQSSAQLGAWTNLHQAVKDGDITSIRSLLEQGANPNAGDLSGYGWTPLHLASARADNRAVALLLEFGANPNVASTGGMGDRVGVTPLHEACECGDLSVVGALLVAGADVNATAQLWRPGCKPYTPLDIATSKGDKIIADRIRIAGGRRHKPS